MTRILFAFAAALLAGSVQAQPWPSKPVRVIVNVAPGGVADVTARVLGARLSETLGQPFVVENRPGGDGYIGFEAVARAEPDGHTVVYSPGSSMMIAPHIVQRADLDPLKLLTKVLIGTIAIRALTILVSLIVLQMEQTIPLGAVLRELMVRQGIFFWPRIIFGVLVPVILAAMIWSTIQIRHTQAATGLLYLAVVALLFGEFFSKFLLFAVNIPL